MMASATPEKQQQSARFRPSQPVPPPQSSAVSDLSVVVPDDNKQPNVPAHFKHITAFITGASRGIGRAIAVALAEEGYNLCLTGRDLDSLKLTITECQNAYVRKFQPPQPAKEPPTDWIKVEPLPANLAEAVTRVATGGGGAGAQVAGADATVVGPSSAATVQAAAPSRIDRTSSSTSSASSVSSSTATSTSSSSSFSSVYLHPQLSPRTASASTAASVPFYVSSLSPQPGAPKILVALFDIRDSRAIKKAVEECALVLGGINILINNAGLTTERADVLTADLDDWDMVLDVNLRSVMHVTRQVAPHITARAKQGERTAIIFVSSITVKLFAFGRAAYAASKHGILGLSGSIFQDLREFGVKVCEVIPGYVNTDMTNKRSDLDPMAMIQPEDIARVALFIIHFPANACPTQIEVQPQRFPGAKK